ncbi:unnamed protein product [Phyllotreta striolata]|uniref:MBD domain-containing protein n=1 Tax=Phyllotreta striolata TaxID=444603 RepID=A0A9N9THR7_PHYSR|nr:unnamed protein product [Phyllotreta striolata]
MAGKHDLSNASGIQNVIVYVSDDNFAQAYSLGQNVQETSQIVQSDGYDIISAPGAPLINPAKPYREKPSVKLVDYPLKQQQVNAIQQGDFYTNAVPQSGFSHGTVNDATFHNGTCDNGEALQDDKHTLVVCNPLRPRGDCNNCDVYEDQDYAKNVTAEVPLQGVCYDNIRLEAADSSCSSLSSSEDGAHVLPNQASEMVVYDPNVNMQPANVVLTVGPQPSQQHSQIIEAFPGHQRPTITIPSGWKRLLNNGSIIYISPTCTALRSSEQVKEYLLSAGTCKCGLECHFKHDSVFNFDPKVIGKPYNMLQDSKSGNMTKLCNHKRKIIPMSIHCPPPDPGFKFQRDINMKRKRRRIGLPYVEGVPQIMSQREKIAFNQNSDKIIAAPQVCPDAENNPHQAQLVKYQDQQGNKVILSDGAVMIQPPNSNDVSYPDVLKNEPVHQINNGTGGFNSHPRQIIGPNGQIIQVRGVPSSSPGNLYHMPNSQGPRMIAHMPKMEQSDEQKVFISRQPAEPTGPGRPNIQIVRVNAPNQHKVVDNQMERNQQKRHMQPLQPQFCANTSQYQQVQMYGLQKHIRPYNQINPGVRPYRMIYQQNQIVQASVQGQNQKQHWQNQNSKPIMEQKLLEQQPQANICERVPPLYQHTAALNVCQDDIKRKKVKIGKFGKNRPCRIIDGCSSNHFSCPNVDIRHIPPEHRTVMMNNFSQNIKSSSPSFMEDPSGYLAQQTALLNSTINRQTGATGCVGYSCSSPSTLCQHPQQHNQSNPTLNNPSNEISVSNNLIGSQSQMESANPMLKISRNNMAGVQNDLCTTVTTLQNNLIQSQPSYDNNTHAKPHQYSAHCHCCVGDGFQMNYPAKIKPSPVSMNVQNPVEDPVTSSTNYDKQFGHNASEMQPIQGGTVSTSNISPIESTSNPPTPDPPQRLVDGSITSSGVSYTTYVKSNVPEYMGMIRQPVCGKPNESICCYHSQASTLVTTMASSRTVGSNTITSVLAGRTNTTTVSLNTPSSVSNPNIITPGQNTVTVHSQAMSTNITKSPLEMVQSIVSSIQIPHSNASQNSQIVKNENLPQEHILVTSGESLCHSQEEIQMSPKAVKNDSMPPVTVSPMVTNVTSSVGTVIPTAVGQPVLGQQTVLVNAVPGQFVLQPGVTMTMDGVPVGQNLQLPQFVAGNIIQQQIQVENSDNRRVPSLLSPDTNKKRSKKRKESSQTVASMLQFANQQNPGVVISPQGFPQQIQMATSPQSVTATPVMQAVTIVPNKTGGAAQIIMNDQAMSNSNIGNQQLLANSQSAQQINLLQPVNLINSSGVVQNFPAIHQFIVPNLGGMVVNPDGTATILQDASNLGMQFQFQNVNGQNLLTPVQNNGLFNNSQAIFAAGPSGMVIRAPTTQGKIIQQQHSPVAQFLSPNGGQFIMNGSQFSGQLSPLVASVSPNQQVTFNSPPQQMRANNSMQPTQQEYIQMNGQLGQTLIVPCTLTSNIPVSNQPSNQNTTFLQQNTTIVQQQTTMLTNQGLQNFQNNQNAPNGSKPAGITSDQIYPNKNLEESRESPKSSSHCRQSVSTQTAVNQNVQSVITNTSCQTSTISAASPPDTTTLSPVPIASEMQSPILADTTTHTDDGLSPIPLACATSRNDFSFRNDSQSCTMAMVHCISSSEPDPQDVPNSEHEWKRLQVSRNGTFPMMGHIDKMSSSHLASVESSTLVTSVHYGSDQEAISSSKNFERKKPSECCVVVDAQHEQMSLFGGNGNILNEGEINDPGDVHGEGHVGHDSEGEEDEDSHEGYLVGSLLINT